MLFRVKYEKYCKLKEIQTGFPQGSILGPLLYVLQASDIPEFARTIMATSADDTVIFSIARSENEAKHKF